MQCSILLTAAMLLVGATAQYDVLCGTLCQDMVTDCCNHNGQACSKLGSTCGANWIANACSDKNGACVTYCSLSGIASCIRAVA